jgi:translation initiation factor 1
MSDAGKKTVRDLSELHALIPGSKPPVEQNPAKKTPLQKLVTLHVLLEKKGRKGKGVTLVTGFHHTQADLLDMARALKTMCGSGGTVKEDAIEIQGDHREKIAGWLRDKGYTVKVRK